jgi:ComF family protein
MNASRSSIREAISSCSQGDGPGGMAAHRSQATGSRVGGDFFSDIAVSPGEKWGAPRSRQQYIEPMTPSPVSRWHDLVWRLQSKLQRNWPIRPGCCAICHAWPSQALCEPCVERFAAPVPRCATCALPLAGLAHRCGHCLTSPPTWDRCLAAVDYGWPWTDLIADFKFHDQPGWARHFAHLMRATHGMQECLDDADLVIGLPLARPRLAERGYNQSELLARALAPYKSRQRPLLRTAHTVSQKSLKREQRMSNLKGAFAVEPLMSQRLRGSHVLLVDDVMTSGASLQAATLALQQAGVAHVSTAVLARTPQPMRP